MATKLPQELRQEVLDNPCQAIPLVDEQTGKTYFVVDEAFLLGPGEHDEQTRLRLTALIEEGLASPKVSREEGHARIRARLSKIADERSR